MRGRQRRGCGSSVSSEYTLPQVDSAEEADEYLLELIDVLDLLAPEDYTEVAFFHRAFLDESERFEDSKIFAVACLAFTRENLRAFLSGWRQMMGGRCFHMADVVGRRNAFEGITPAERDQLITNAVQLVKRYRLVSTACSCSAAEFADLQRLRPFRGFNTPYAVCAQTCMVLLANWLRRTDSPGKVAYFFEDGHRDAADAKTLLSRIESVPGLRDSYRYRSSSFVPKEDATPLQGADLLAWEYAKHQAEPWRLRTSYVELSVPPEQFVAVHRDRAGLQELMDYTIYASHVPEPTDEA